MAPDPVPRDADHKPDAAAHIAPKNGDNNRQGGNNQQQKPRNSKKDKEHFGNRANPIKGLRDLVKRRPSIDEVVRETTSGGVVFRRNPKSNQIEILLIQDAKSRWTIPKGHVEEGEEP